MKFGVEIEFGGLYMDEAAHVLSKVLGREAHEYLGDYYVRDEQGRDWEIKEDGSVNRMGGEGLELATPPLTQKDIPLLCKIVRALGEHGAAVDSSCGIHVHVDGDEFRQLSTLKNLVRLFATHERTIYAMFNVHGSRSANFCIRLNKSRQAFLQSLKAVKTKRDLMREWYDGKLEDADFDRHWTRYHGLNLHSYWFRGTVEFRLFNSTLDPVRVWDYILFTLALVRYAQRAERTQLRKSAYPTSAGAKKLLAKLNLDKHYRFLELVETNLRDWDALLRKAKANGTDLTRPAHLPWEE